VSIDRALRNGVDVAKLRVTVGMLATLSGLDVRLQAVPQPSQQLRDRREMGPMPELPQPLSEVAHTLGSPSQKRLRIATGVRIDQPLEIAHQRRVELRQRLAPTTRLAHPPRRKPLTGPKLSHPLADRFRRDTRRPRRRRDPTPPSSPRLARRPQPPLALIQLTSKRPELLTDHNLIDHTQVSTEQHDLLPYLPTDP
jgi:hypothetical protein